MNRNIARAIDLLAKVELSVAVLALALDLALAAGCFPTWSGITSTAWLLLVALALMVVASGALFFLDGWLVRRDMKRKAGGKLEVRDGTVRTAPRVRPNEPCWCGSGRKLKRCCIDKPRPGVPLGNGMRLVDSQLRDPTGKRVQFPS